MTTPAGGGFLLPDISEEEVLPPSDYSPDAAVSGTIGAFTMIRDTRNNSSEPLKLASYPSGSGINWNKDNSSDTSGWTWLSASSGEVFLG